MTQAGCSTAIGTGRSGPPCWKTPDKFSGVQVGFSKPRWDRGGSPATQLQGFRSTLVPSALVIVSQRFAVQCRHSARSLPCVCTSRRASSCGLLRCNLVHSPVGSNPSMANMPIWIYSSISSSNGLPYSTSASETSYTNNCSTVCPAMTTSRLRTFTPRIVPMFSLTSATIATPARPSTSAAMLSRDHHRQLASPAPFSGRRPNSQRKPNQPRRKSAWGFTPSRVQAAGRLV